jgi:hypothetical protein
MTRIRLLLALPIVIVALSTFLLLPKEPVSENTYSVDQVSVGSGDVVTTKKLAVAEGVRQGASEGNSDLREQDIDAPKLKETNVGQLLSCDDLGFVIGAMKAFECGGILEILI